MCDFHLPSMATETSVAFIMLATNFNTRFTVQDDRKDQEHKIGFAFQSRKNILNCLSKQN
jgi:hypothetical protein